MIPNITSKTTLESVTKDQLKPNDFIRSVTDGYKTISFLSNFQFLEFSDGLVPRGDSWMKSYKVSSSYVDKGDRKFTPCFTYDNPNEYSLGKRNSTVIALH